MVNGEKLGEAEMWNFSKWLILTFTLCNARGPTDNNFEQDRNYR